MTSERRTGETTTPAPASGDAAEHLALADRLAAAGETTAAIAYARLALAALRHDAAPGTPALDRRQARATRALARAFEDAGDTAAAGIARARARGGAAPQVDTLLEDARRALDDGAAPEARRACELILAMAPERPAAHLLAGDLAAAGAGLDRRIMGLAAAAGLTPEDAAPRLRLARRFKALGRTAAAAAALRGVLRLDPEEAEAWYLLADLLREAGHAAAALPVARHLRTLAPDHRRGAVLLADLLDTLGLADEAVEAHQEALALGVDSPEIARRLEAALESRGLWTDLMETRRAAVRRNPGDAAALRALGEALARLGRHAEALAWFRRAVDAAPDDAEARLRLTESLLRRRAWAEARDHLQRHGSPDAGWGLPAWTGVASDPVVLHHADDDGLEGLLLGLGVARAADLEPAVLVVPAAAAPLARRALPAAEVVVREEERFLTAAVAASGATHQARVADLPALLGDRPGVLPLPAWLAPGPEADAGRQGLGFALEGPTAPPRTLWDDLLQAFGPQARPIDADGDPEWLVALLSGVEAVVTVDGPVAHLTGAMGLPGIVVLPPDAPWWWGDAGSTCPWYPDLTLIRAAAPDEWHEAVEAVMTVISEAPAPGPETPERAATGEPELDETLERVAPALGVPPAAVSVEPLPADRDATRVRLATPAGPFVLRLPQFPPPQPEARAREMHNMRLAAEAGLAPDPLHADDLDGTLLYAEPEGRAWTLAAVRRPEAAAAVGALYARLHGLGGFRGLRDPLAALRRRTARLDDAAVPLFRQRTRLRPVIDEVVTVLAGHGVPAASCHNRPLAACLAGPVEAPVLTGWSASAMADPHWEAASFIVRTGLPGEARDAFLAAYLPAPDAPEVVRLPLLELLVCWDRWTRAVERLHADPADALSERRELRWWERLLVRLNDQGFSGHLAAARAWRHPDA